jgi:hypothetical protein
LWFIRVESGKDFVLPFFFSKSEYSWVNKQWKIFHHHEHSMQVSFSFFFLFGWAMLECFSCFVSFWFMKKWKRDAFAAFFYKHSSREEEKWIVEEMRGKANIGVNICITRLYVFHLISVYVSCWDWIIELLCYFNNK